MNYWEFRESIIMKMYYQKIISWKQKKGSNVNVFSYSLCVYGRGEKIDYTEWKCRDEE